MAKRADRRPRSRPDRAAASDSAEAAAPVDPTPSPDLSDDHYREIAAAAYQADRIRRAALELGGWAATYLKHRKYGGAEIIAARKFVDAAVTLRSIIVWNEVGFEASGW